MGDSIDLERPTSKSRRGRVAKGVAHTITTNPQQGILDIDYRIRKLMPIEYWRLMGFSDDDFLKVKGIGISNSQLYKQAGNSIVVNVLMEIHKNLFSMFEAK
ncbi:DNA cytosine methyltransferase [Zhenhengia yiwuensis]|uniref:DNA cytosine methyltransferase n=1 Tax=Zhenhengia yiwuensis TaxID=2763666 RepID=UPI002ED2BA55